MKNGKQIAFAALAVVAALGAVGWFAIASKDVQRWLKYGGRYTVEPGDSLSWLAKDAYSDIDLWPCLLNANPHLATRPGYLLEIGEEILVPRRSELELRKPELQVMHEPSRSCVCPPGWTLPEIAEVVYGKRSAWGIIYNANRDRITAAVLDDPTLLSPGLLLSLPLTQDHGQGILNEVAVGSDASSQ